MRSFVWFALAVSLAAAAEPPKLRLGDDVRPVKYAADLTLVPGAVTFAGSVDIDVALSHPSSLIWLNATDLTISQATVTHSGRSETAAVEKGDDNFTALRLPAELPAGPAVLHIRYQGKIDPKGSAGVFEGKDGGETYLYTQFESTDARRTFPCFDQPNFKTPWQLTLHVRSTDRAFSNSPQLSETPEANGMKRVVFAPTKPLPSYLVAAAVGPFEVVESGRAGRNRVPVRIVVPKGKVAWARYAAEVTAGIVQRLEDYFGVPFPFDKVDNVAIAVSAGFAMENAGMVTYAQDIILNDPATDTINRQRGYASVAAHELAHQWFGDLVTMDWWDDIWLNEAFATWTSSKILATWKPEWQTRVNGDLGSIFGAMGNDSLVSARQIRQPITSQDDIANAFDGITYEKGASVIRMFESWMGESDFQKGIHSYLTRYSYKNARVNDFLDSVGSAGHPGLGQAFTTFLDQPGIPEIAADVQCSGKPRVRLSQSRYLPIGSAGAGKPQWKTPVCVRYPNASGPQSECFLLETPSAEFPLSKADSCPAYLFANADAAGYYIATYSPDALSRLTANASSLSVAERVSLLHDLQAAANAGHLKPSAALEASAPFANAPQRAIVRQAQSIVAEVRPTLPAELTPNYDRYVRKVFGPRAESLGWTAAPGEDDDKLLLRPSLVPFVAARGDAALQSQARRLADGWLKDRKGIDANLLSAVLSTAARSGDQALFEGFRTALKGNQDPGQRETLLSAVGSFRDPKIVEQAFSLLLDPNLDIREALGLFFGPLGDRQTEKLPFQFLKSHYDAVLKRLPSTAGLDMRAFLPFVGGSFCDEPSRREFVDFFQERVKTYTGGQHNYDQALEGIRLCEAHRAAQEADLAQFFSRQ